MEILTYTQQVFTNILAWIQRLYFYLLRLKGLNKVSDDSVLFFGHKSDRIAGNLRQRVRNRLKVRSNIVSEPNGLYIAMVN